MKLYENARALRAGRYDQVNLNDKYDGEHEIWDGMSWTRKTYMKWEVTDMIEYIWISDTKYYAARTTNL